MRKLVLLLILLSGVFASIYLVLPVNIMVRPLHPISVNPVGPGHEVFLKFERASASGFYWDDVKIINEIDSDWEAVPSSDHAYLYYSILVPKEKPSGEYTFEFEITDAQGMLNQEVAVVQVSVTHDPADLVSIGEYSQEFEFNAGEVSEPMFNIENKAMSRVTYMVTSTIDEIPSFEHVGNHNFTSLENKQISVPVQVEQEGVYTLRSMVWSEDNPTISKQVTTTLVVKPTLHSKLKSIGQGIPLIPITFAPFYALLGLLGL